MKIQDARSLPSVAQEDLRRKVVKALLSGKKPVEVVKLFGVSRQAVWKWKKVCARGGIKELRSRRRGRPRGGGSLLPWQAAQIARLVVARVPEQLQLPFALWTREAVQMLIYRKFRKKLSLMTVGRYLKRWGFTPQKPVRRAYEQDGEAVRRWLEEEYPRIRRQARREKAQIFWGDETGVRSDYAAGRSYSKRGKTPVIPGTGQRFSCNMISVITNRGQLSFMVFKKNFRAEVFIEFLRRLLRQVKGRIFLILDSHPVHLARKVKRWMEAKQDCLRLFYLPGYSPELNPDEMLNNDVKSNAAGRRRPYDQEEMMENIRSYLRGTQKRPDIVRNYFQAETVRYAAL